MKTDPDSPIAPCLDTLEFRCTGGLTKREYFAALAMQGMVANPAIIGPNPTCGVAYVNGSPETLAQMAVHQADALIVELNKQSL
jgi:hypothetical protein